MIQIQDTIPLWTERRQDKPLFPGAIMTIYQRIELWAEAEEEERAVMEPTEAKAGKEEVSTEVGG
jgi:hypothetical protein